MSQLHDKEIAALRGLLGVRRTDVRPPDFEESLLARTPRFAWEPDDMATNIIDIEEKQMARGAERRPLRRSTMVLSGLAAAALVVVAGFAVRHFMAPPAVPSVALRGTAVFVQGEVFRIRGQARERLRAGNFLKAGDRIETASDALADLKLSNESLVRVQGNTNLTIGTLAREGQAEKVRLTLDRGWARNLTTRKSKDAVYTLRAPTAIASVRGTAFDVVVDPDGADFRVLEGSIAVGATAGGAENVLAVGEHLRVGTSGPRGTAAKLDAARLREMEVAYRQMRARLAGDDALLKQVRSVEPVKNEADLRARYKNLEILVLKDGRRLRGATVAQSGTRLVFQSVADVEIIEMDAIERVLIAR